METKICRTCKKEKKIDEFSWRNKIKKQKHGECKDCYKITRKKSYENNKQYYLNKNKRRRLELKNWFDSYKKDKKCVFCGESESICLDFHHLDNSKKEYNVSNMNYSTYSIKTIKKEIDKCIIVCANCHRKLHAGIIHP